MLKLRKVAVTGGLSCGKSSVCRFFKQLGAYVVSADEIVHQLLSPHTSLGKKIIDLLGIDSVDDQHFNRAKIAQKVFRDPELLQAYEHLIHPEVQKEIERQYQEIKLTQKAPLFIAEIPLLFEKGGEKIFDATIVVLADPKTCKKRFCSIKQDEPEEYERRMSRQLDPEEKAKRATFIIRNDGSLEDLQQPVEKLFNQLTNLNTKGV